MQHSPANAASSRASSWLPVVSAILAVAGIAVAGYLTLTHYRSDLLVCVVGGCGTVQKSEYATMAGVPVALLGLGMFTAVAGLGVLRWSRPAIADYATLTAFCLAMTGTIFAAYLTYLELFVINAICQWCVLTAILTTALLVVEGSMAWRLLGHDELGDQLDSVTQVPERSVLE
jgi:uncharacterized membrane protein